MFAGYDYTIRPNDPFLTDSSVCSLEGRPDHVLVGLGIERLGRVDTRSKMFQLDGYLRQWWEDPRLAFPPGDCRDSLVFYSSSPGGHRMWTPGINIQQMAKELLGGRAEESLVIYRNGSILWSQRLSVEITCHSMNFGRLPYDVQHCPISLRSYLFNTSQVNISWQEPGIRVIHAMEHGEWNAIVGELRETVVGFSTGVYGYANVCIKLERDSVLYMSSMRSAVLLVIACYCGFFISAAAVPARVTLDFICFLMVLTNMNTVYQSLPPLRTQDSSVWLTDFLFGTLLFNFATLIAYALTNFSNVAKCSVQNGADEQSSDEWSDDANECQQHRRLQIACNTLGKLDMFLRILFLPAYAVFYITMHAINPFYDGSEDCVFDG